MKVFKYIFLFISVLALSSCQEDIIAIYGCTNPAAENYDPDATIDNNLCEGIKGCTDSTATNFNVNATVNCGCKYENTRRVLLEEFTGHKCGNCPRAAETLKDLMCLNGDQIIGMATHVGFFAWPSGDPYEADYRNPAGDEIDEEFGNSVTGLPNGLVNRKEFDGSKILINTAWEEKITAILAEPADAKLTISNVYNSDSRDLNTVVTTEVLRPLEAANYNLAIYVLEDSIVSAQTDYQADPTTIEDYLHMHMMRGSMNGTWGETISTSALSIGEQIETTASLTLPEELKDQHVYIVTVLSNNETREVIQANQSSYINE